MSKRFLVLLTIACVLLSLASAYAQTTATIRGRVADPQDAIVVGATVVARNVATGIEQRTTTTSDGVYTIPALASGTYNVRVEAPNFAIAETKAVALQVGDTRDVNFRLKVGGATQVIEVTGEAPLVETSKTEGSTVLNSTDIARLPALSGTAPRLCREHERLCLASCWCTRRAYRFHRRQRRPGGTRAVQQPQQPVQRGRRQHE